MKHNHLFLIAIALVLGIAFFGCKKHEVLTPKITDDKVEVTATTATFTWTVDWPGKLMSVVEVSEYEDMSYSQIYGSEEETENHSFSVMVNHLKPVTKYYYRYLVWNQNYVDNKYVFEVKSFSIQSDLPYYQDFTSSFGTYTTFDVLGDQHWEIDYNTAIMTGYVNSTYHNNEDWLISKRFSFENVTKTNLTMTYIARYFNDLDNDLTLWVSDDYTGGNPTLATWTRIPASWVEGSNWSNFSTTTLDLSQFAGKLVNVALRYVSNEQTAGTIEIKSILIQKE